MTRGEIEQLLRDWQSFLLLDHWTVDINWDEEPDEEDALADVSIPSGRYHATIRFSRGTEDADIADVAMRVCHELLHLHLNAIDDTTRAILQQTVKFDDRCVISSAMHLEIERATDALTTALIRNVGIRPKRVDGTKLDTENLTR